jgi:hypothetical protein
MHMKRHGGSDRLTVRRVTSSMQAAGGGAQVAGLWGVLSDAEECLRSQDASDGQSVLTENRAKKVVALAENRTRAHTLATCDSTTELPALRCTHWICAGSWKEVQRLAEQIG